MKMFTAAAALEEGVIGLHTPIQDSKSLVFGDNIVQNFDKKSMGEMPFEDAIAHSRNVATGKVALMLGQTTDAGVAGALRHVEAPGHRRADRHRAGQRGGRHRRRPVADAIGSRSTWSTVHSARPSRSRRCSSCAHSRRWPTAACSSSRTSTRRTTPRQRRTSSRSSRPQLSDTLRQLMVHVVDEGPNYAEETKIPGYVVGGKTGTAQIWDSQAGGWLADTYNHTFVGFVGNERPEAIILVRIHDTIPRVPKKWGMSLEMTSNELWRRVALDAIAALDLQPLSGLERRRPTHANRPSRQPPSRPRSRPTRRRLPRSPDCLRTTPQATDRRCENGRTWLTARTRPRSSSFDSESLAAAVGGVLLRAGTAPIRGGAVDSRLGRAGQRLLRAQRRAHRRSYLHRRGRSSRRGCARRRALPQRRGAGRARRHDGGGPT